MNFKEFLLTEATDHAAAKASAAKAQAVWAERDPDKKFAMAQSFINTMKFKDKIPTNLRKLEGMKGNINKIDKFIGDIQLKGEGQGVAR